MEDHTTAPYGSRHGLMWMRGRRDGGFTLIELLVVVIIVGVLAAIAVPAYLGQRKKGLEATVKVDVKNAALAAHTIAVDNPDATTNVFTQSAMRAAGFKKSPGNQVGIAGTPAAGFCILGYNPQSDATSDAAAFFYDSNNGGLRVGTPASMPGGPVGAACRYVVTDATGWHSQ